MSNSSEMDRSIWEAHKRIWHESVLHDWLSYVGLAKEMYPDISYDVCCEIARSHRHSNSLIDIPYTPTVFGLVCKEIVNKIKPSSAFIPFADGSEVPFFRDCKETDYCIYNNEFEQAVKRFESIHTVEKEHKGKYAFIAADLPIDRLNEGFIPGDILLQSIENLTEDGMAAFVLSKGVTLGRDWEWIKKLEKKEFFCNAILEMPLNSYGRLTQIQTVIAIFSRNKKAERFVASISDELSVGRIIGNYLSENHKSRRPEDGVFVDRGVSSYSKYDNAIQIQKMKVTLKKKYNGECMALSDIAEVKLADRDGVFQDDSNAVYISRFGYKKVVTSVEDITGPTRNWFQIVVNDELVLPRFLAFFLNSDDGEYVRRLHSDGVSSFGTIHRTSLLDIIVPCPGIELQSEYMKTYNQLEQIKTEAGLLQRKLLRVPASYKNIRREIKDINNHDDKFVRWFENLPYPLATILKRYSVVSDYASKQESLFFFFEAYAIFESTLLSAAMDKSIIDNSTLGNVSFGAFEKASFGNWIYMGRALSGLYLSMLDGQKELHREIPLSCFHTKDDKMIRLICSKDMWNKLEAASEKRNLWKGHVGLTSEIHYREHVDVLDEILNDLVGAVQDLYERIRLIRAPKKIEYTDDEKYVIDAEILTGSNPMFSRETIISNRPIKGKKLYIQVMDTGEMLELPPFFILKGSPSDVENACYFYSRMEAGNTRYVSYHYDGVPEDTESGDIVYSFIKDILT